MPLSHPVGALGGAGCLQIRTHYTIKHSYPSATGGAGTGVAPVYFFDSGSLKVSFDSCDVKINMGSDIGRRATAGSGETRRTGDAPATVSDGSGGVEERDEGTSTVS